MNKKIKLFIQLFFLSILSLGFIRLDFLVNSFNIKIEPISCVDLISYNEVNKSKYVFLNSAFTEKNVFDAYGRISKTSSSLQYIQIDKDYNLQVRIGEMIKSNQILAKKINDIIYSSFCGRIIDSFESETSITIVLDPIDNYEFLILLPFNNSSIINDLKKLNNNKFELNISDFSSSASLKEIKTNLSNKNYELHFSSLDFNPFIISGAIGKISKVLTFGQTYLLYPKYLPYILDNSSNYIFVKRKGLDGNIEDVTLQINSALSSEEYFFIYEYSKNVGEYLANIL